MKIFYLYAFVVGKCVLKWDRTVGTQKLRRKLRYDLKKFPGHNLKYFAPFGVSIWNESWLFLNNNKGLSLFILNEGFKNDRTKAWGIINCRQILKILKKQICYIFQDFFNKVALMTKLVPNGNKAVLIFFG